MKYELQVMSIKNGYQIIIVKNMKLEFRTSYIFDNKQMALKFIKDNYSSIINEYKKCKGVYDEKKENR